MPRHCSHTLSHHCSHDLSNHTKWVHMCRASSVCQHTLKPTLIVSNLPKKLLSYLGGLEPQSQDSNQNTSLKITTIFMQLPLALHLDKRKEMHANRVNAFVPH